jgi:putative restriction endonuclease
MTSIANEADFFRFMEDHGPASDGGKRNYLSWLRYVKELYGIDYDNLTFDVVEQIFQTLRSTQTLRNKYTSNSAISDIKSALNKYLAFISNNDNVSSVATDVVSIANVNSTTTKTEIETRLGQGKYRQDLIQIWRKCAVTEFSRVDLLVASHIKPWKKSTDVERVDPYNGLLLSPTLDKLFDRGYISFTDAGDIIISPLLAEQDLDQLSITNSMKLYKVERGCLPYLKFHRDVVFIRQI